MRNRRYPWHGMSPGDVYTCYGKQVTGHPTVVKARAWFKANRPNWQVSAKRTGDQVEIRIKEGPKGTKVCRRCKKPKPAFMYLSRPLAADGLGSTCKTCRRPRKKKVGASWASGTKGMERRHDPTFGVEHYRSKYGLSEQEESAVLSAAKRLADQEDGVPVEPIEALDAPGPRDAALCSIAIVLGNSFVAADSVTDYVT